MTWVWIIYALVVLVISGVIGLHIGKFREAYTEMTGMMAGMTMGMMNGFVLGYAAAAATDTNMFWGNVFGILLGVALGLYFGRAGGLMGIMDGAMGGLMGGSMGAMLLVMVNPFGGNSVLWTAVLLSVCYIVSMLGLVVLIERGAPEQAALHRLIPYFTRTVAAEVAEELARTRTQSPAALSITDYYAFLGVSSEAGTQEITDAYLARLATADASDVELAERAVSTLTEPARRAAYDRKLQEALAAADGPGACCPPPKKRKAPAVEQGQAVTTSGANTPVRAAGTVAATASTAKTAVTARAARAQTTPNGKAVPSQKSVNGKAPQAQTRRSLQEARRPATRGKAQEKEAPVSWVGGVMALLIMGTLVVWWLMAQSGSLGTTAVAGSSTVSQAAGQDPNAIAQQLEARAVNAALSANGTQTLDFVVNGTTWSYKPDVVKVKAGVPVRFNLSTEGRDPGCGRFVGVKGLGVHGIATPGQVSAMEFTPSQPGVYEINCGMDMMLPGYLIVAAD